MRIFSVLQASAMVLAVGIFPAAKADVFINELHYDNTGVDSGEAIEVVATGGEDLSLYSIVLYNGSTGQSYDTDPVPAGVLGNCVAGGSAVFSTVIPGQIENGAPDGLALVGPSGVIQFLSYEGEFAAVGGAANGLMSQDIGVAEANDSALGLSLQLTGGPGATYAEFAWAGSSDDNFGACNTGQSFGAPVDNPPTVTSTSPVAGSNTAPVNADIVINFSEPVAVVDPWLSLECNGFAYTGQSTSSNGGATWTFNPDNDLTSGESCAVSITSANVTDLDGPADALSGTNNFIFTVAPDNAPTVLSSVPADNAINVVASSNISITFSEPVTFTPPLDTALSCSITGNHPFALSGGPTVYTLNPNTDFGVENCTLTIAAADVVDQDGVATQMAANFVLNFSTIESLAGNYYDGVDTTSCTTLRNSLHDLIDDHIAFPYTSDSADDTWTILELADQDPSDTGRVLEVYENNSHAKFGGGNSNYNREHTWPNSYGFNDLSNAPGDIPQSAAFTDTHMLYLSDVQHNNTRGNKPFADCPQVDGCNPFTTLFYNNQGGGPVVYPGNHNWSDATNGNQGSFEVWNFRKGDIARAVMYMDIRYEGDVANEPDLILTDDRNLIQPTPSGAFAPIGYMGLLSTLLAWHAADPPDAQEQLRNDVIFSYQQNRNPFIDHPEWACVLTNPCSCALTPPGPEPLIFLNGFE